MPWEEWMVYSPNDEKTRINRCYKTGKYIVFERDDGKECKYDLSSGDAIGFRGKPVKTLASQLKDLSCKRLFEITEDRVYREYFEYVWFTHRNNKAWVFLYYTLPEFLDYEQYFTSGFTNIEKRLKYGYSQIPKGLFKFCDFYGLTLTNKLAKSYIENPDAFNILYSIDLGVCTPQKMIDAMIYGTSIESKCDQWRPKNNVVEEKNLLIKRKTKCGQGQFVRNDTPRGRNSYFISLVSDYGYNPKLLINYIESVKIHKKFKRAIFQDIYDYASMMVHLYDNYDRYPENFPLAHRRACEEYNRTSIEYDETKYVKRNVLDYECEIDGFKFIYPKTTEQIKEEGIRQHNCVASYINRVLSENCHIMFMRRKDEPEKNYITLEIRDNEIVQAKRPCNQEPSTEEWAAIKKWNEKYKDYKES